MKRFITVLMSAMIALSMMPATAFAAISASDSVNITPAINFLKSNLYNSSSLTKSTTYSVDDADSVIEGDLKANYYVKVADVDEEIKRIQCGKNVFNANDTFKLSVGNNVFIQDKAFYVEGDSLYVATVLVAPHNSILVNGTTLELNLSPATTSLTASKIEKWNSGGDLNVTRGEGNSCTVEASGANVKGALYIGIGGADKDTMFITEKTYKNGSTTYGLTGADSQGEEYGLAFYPFGWNTDLTNPSNVTAYDGNSLNYSIYAVGLGVCTATINYKVGGVKAEVNGVKYTSLKDAINAVKDGQTISLLNNLVLEEPLKIDNGKSFALNLNGYSIENQYIDLYSGFLTISNGTLKLRSYVNTTDKDTKYNSLTIDKDVVIDGPEYGIIAFQKDEGSSNYGSTINFHGKMQNVKAGLWVMGNIHTDITSAENPVTVNVDGEIYCDADYAESVGIALNGAAIMNIDEGSVIEGATGVEVRAGNLTVNGGKFTGTVKPTKVTSNGNGTATVGAGIAVAQHTTALPINVVVKGGTIEGFTGLLVTNPENRGNADKVQVTVEGGDFSAINDGTNSIDREENAKDMSVNVSGGIFSSNPKAYVAVGTNIYRQHAGNYFVGSMPASTSGYNAWALQNGVYEETYVAPAEPETPDAPVIDNSGSGADATTNVDASASTVVKDDKAETSINLTTGNKIVENAKENNVSEVVIKAETEKGEATGSTVALPESTVQALAAEDVQASVTIKTDNATVTLDKDAVKATAEQAGTDGEVKLVVETKEKNKNKVEIELKLVTSKGTVSDFKGGNVTVAVPVSEELAGKKLVCVYIDENGKYTKMEGELSKDGKSYIFKTGHFSTYAILSEEEANAVIDGQNISKATVSGLANKTYTGKAITQKLTVKAGDKALVEGTDYTVTYSKNVNVGVASVKITGKGKYEGTLTKTFKINPKGTSISKVTGQKKAVKVVWKKQLTKMKTSYVSGYQVQYSTSSKFTSGTSKYANAKFSKGRTTKTIKNLKSGKKYYVRVRTYKSVDGTKCYSSWSKVKSVKTK